METKEIFAKRVIALRKEKGISQSQLADLVGISKTSANLYESASRVPDIQVLVRYAIELEVTTDYLLGLSDNRTSENAGIGDRLGLNDDAIEALSNYVQLRDTDSQSKGYYRRCLDTINAIINEHDLVDALKSYVFHELNEYVSLSEWHTNMLNNGGEADYEKFCEAAQAINMYNVQCKLLDLSINFGRMEESTNAKKD